MEKTIQHYRSKGEAAGNHRQIISNALLDVMAAWESHPQTMGQILSCKYNNSASEQL